MKMFLDTEFTGLHAKTTLISLGLIDENDRTFYAEFTDFDTSQCDDWIKKNVIKNLLMLGEKGLFHFETKGGRNGNFEVKGNTENIKEALEEFLKIYDTVEIWSDCLSYDWVLFNNIWGHAFNIPENIYYVPFDICTVFKMKGIDPDISREAFIENSIEGEKHNALYDAKVIKSCYEKLMGA